MEKQVDWKMQASSGALSDSFEAGAALDLISCCRPGTGRGDCLAGFRVHPVTTVTTSQILYGPIASDFVIQAEGQFDQVQPCFCILVRAAERNCDISKKLLPAIEAVKRLNSQPGLTLLLQTGLKQALIRFDALIPACDAELLAVVTQ